MKITGIIFFTLLTIFAHPAFAAPVTIDLDIEITSDITGGTYLGEQGQGTISYNDDIFGTILTGSCPETLEINSGAFTLAIDILGLNLTPADDVDYPLYPQLFFIDGVFDGLDFLVVLAGTGL